MNRIEIFSIDGMKVFSAIGHREQVALSHLTAGMYVVKVGLISPAVAKNGELVMVERFVKF